MTFLSHEQASELYQHAREASKNTYSPYSKFPVGAAILTIDDTIFEGTNIENASFSLTICAERIGLGNAVTNGYKIGEIKAIAVYSPVTDVSPCGACRQFIYEFGTEIIIIFKQNDKLTQKKISELLPGGFDKTQLV